MSGKDFLTGCLNKESIQSTLEKIKAECDVNKKPFSILTIDLDNFKLYNDKYGHIDGDDALRYFASTLSLSLREEESYVFRFGGDEFILAFPGKTGSDTYAIANHVIKMLSRRPMLAKGRIFKLSFSGGIASYPSDGRDIEEILQKADKAMYFSKTHGRKKATMYNRISQEIVERGLLVFVTVLVMAGTVVFTYKNVSDSDIIDFFRGKMRKAVSTITGLSVNTDKEDLDTIYLKSGRILKGVVVRDDADEIELNLNLETGKGLIIVKRAEIKDIKIHPKEAVSSQKNQSN